MADGISSVLEAFFPSAMNECDLACDEGGATVLDRAAADLTPESEALRGDAARRLRRALATLSPRAQALIVLKFGLFGHEERSPDELARMAGCAKWTIHNWTRRALTALRHALDAERSGAGKTSRASETTTTPHAPHRSRRTKPRSKRFRATTRMTVPVAALTLTVTQARREADQRVSA